MCTRVCVACARVCALAATITCPAVAAVRPDWPSSVLLLRVAGGCDHLTTPKSLPGAPPNAEGAGWGVIDWEMGATCQDRGRGNGEKTRKGIGGERGHFNLN